MANFRHKPKIKIRNIKYYEVCSSNTSRTYTNWVAPNTTKLSTPWYLDVCLYTEGSFQYFQTMQLLMKMYTHDSFTFGVFCSLLWKLGTLKVLMGGPKIQRLWCLQTTWLRNHTKMLFFHTLNRVTWGKFLPTGLKEEWTFTMSLCNHVTRCILKFNVKICLYLTLWNSSPRVFGCLLLLHSTYIEIFSLAPCSWKCLCPSFNLKTTCVHSKAPLVIHYIYIYIYIYRHLMHF